MWKLLSIFLGFVLIAGCRHKQSSLEEKYRKYAPWCQGFLEMP